jgi:hypothetical protein
MEIRIIGGSHAAIACATRAREEYPNARIVIYEKNKNMLPCLLPKIKTYKFCIALSKISTTALAFFALKWLYVSMVIDNCA